MHIYLQVACNILRDYKSWGLRIVNEGKEIVSLFIWDDDLVPLINLQSHACQSVLSDKLNPLVLVELPHFVSLMFRIKLIRMSFLYHVEWNTKLKRPQKPFGAQKGKSSYLSVCQQFLKVWRTTEWVNEVMILITMILMDKLLKLYCQVMSTLITSKTYDK